VDALVAGLVDARLELFTAKFAAENDFKKRINFVVLSELGKKMFKTLPYNKHFYGRIITGV
jgi:hypothetical protein